VLSLNAGAHLTTQEVISDENLAYVVDVNWNGVKIMGGLGYRF
jgi:hypothetical protein